MKERCADILGDTYLRQVPLPQIPGYQNPRLATKPLLRIPNYCEPITAGSKPSLSVQLNRRTLFSIPYLTPTQPPPLQLNIKPTH